MCWFPEFHVVFFALLFFSKKLLFFFLSILGARGQPTVARSCIVLIFLKSVMRRARNVSRSHVLSSEVSLVGIETLDGVWFFKCLVRRKKKKKKPGKTRSQEEEKRLLDETARLAAKKKGCANLRRTTLLPSSEKVCRRGAENGICQGTCEGRVLLFSFFPPPRRPRTDGGLWVRMHRTRLAGDLEPQRLGFFGNAFGNPVNDLAEAIAVLLGKGQKGNVTLLA
jgi:hypothetical protein